MPTCWMRANRMPTPHPESLPSPPSPMGHCGQLAQTSQCFTGNRVPKIFLAPQPHQTHGWWQTATPLPPTHRWSYLQFEGLCSLTALTLPFNRCRIPTGSLWKPFMAWKTSLPVKPIMKVPPQSSTVLHGQGSWARVLLHDSCLFKFCVLWPSFTACRILLPPGIKPRPGSESTES